jgi:hypothetical protein
VTTHSSPRSSSARVVCEPMKPRPPVTRIMRRPLGEVESSIGQ